MSVPEDPRVQLMRQAVETLRDCVAFERHTPCPASHVVVVVKGLDAARAISALGCYLTGLIAGTVLVDLSLCEQMLGQGPEYASELAAEVVAVIGDSNNLDKTQKEDARNPWIAECLAHALLMIGRSASSECVPGEIHAITLPHDKVTQQGLDLVGLFSASNLAVLCIGESKASEEYPQNHLQKAIALFRAIDRAERDHQIRTVVLGALLPSLPDTIRQNLHGTFWRSQRLYLPVLAYASGCSFLPHSNRPDTFGQLKVPAEYRRLVVVALSNHHGFFDCVAEAMRRAVPAFANV